MLEWLILGTWVVIGMVGVFLTGCFLLGVLLFALLLKGLFILFGWGLHLLIWPIRVLFALFIGALVMILMLGLIFGAAGALFGCIFG